jgi:regulator of replication initiation timing
LKVERDKMKKQIRLLTNENKFLKEKIEKLTMKLNKPEEKKEKKEKPIKSEKVDFKKKFLDSL